ncbi:MAG: hypothetical protein BWZ07_02283 [Alphaproteobacteria bacterium ADurb.BinA280]|nr:MAG: hypothetical protein BWZ07_02283 [Alphaproteobacteria bacterium ADurb.BinA280]
MGIDCGVVQAGRVEIPYQLVDTCAGIRRRGLLGNLALQRQRALGQRFESTPGGAIRGHWIVGQPARVDEGVEVVTGRRIGIEICRIQLDGRNQITAQHR